MPLYGIAHSESLQSSDHTHQLVEAIQLATMVEVEEVSVLWWEGVTCVYHTL